MEKEDGGGRREEGEGGIDPLGISSTTATPNKGERPTLK
jgi:hypothetical protein